MIFYVKVGMMELGFIAGVLEQRCAHIGPRSI